MKNCPKCNANISDTAKFCVKCGFNIKKYEEEINKEYFCAECGTKFSGGTFCPECGYNVQNDLNGGAELAIDNGNDIDFSTINQMASDQLFEKEGFTVDNGVLMSYKGNKRSIVIHDVEEIYDGAFKDNQIVTFIEIKDGVKIIGKKAFSDCKSLIKISIPSSVEKIYEDTFEKVNLEEIELPSLDENLINNLVSNLAKEFLQKNDIKSFVSKSKSGICINIKKIEDTANLEKEKRDKKILSWEIGGSPVFGTYFIDNEEKRKDLEWLVIDRVGCRALVVTKDCIDIPTSNGDCENLWEKTAVSKWLNNEFFTQSFSDSEKECVIKQRVFTPSGYYYVAGSYADYNVFLLSKRDVEMYREKSSLDFSCGATEYAKSKGITLDAYKKALWWLQAESNVTSNFSRTYYWACTADGKSFVNSQSGYSSYKIGIRPAMWIDVSFLNQK